MVLEILHKWGKHDHHPRPREIVHVDAICPPLIELRQWTGNITLVKVKSITWYLLDECAESWLSWAGLKRNLCSVLACKSVGPFGLGLDPLLDKFAAKSGKSLPRESAPNASIIQQVVAVNALQTVKKRSTVFVIS